VLEESVSTEAPVTESAASPEAPAAATPEVPAAPSDAPTEPPPAYTPNLKFKVHDKELEIDSWMAQVIKDQETEKKVRALYEKAYGLDYVKQDRSKLRDELGNVKGTYEKTMAEINSIVQLRDKGDLPGFFEKIGVDEDTILKYAIQVAQRRNNPEADSQFRQSRQFAQERDQLAAREAQLQAQYQQTAVQAKNFELQQVMSRPDVVAIQQAFDARMGEGAFHREVIGRGQLHWSVSQKDISAEQAVNEVLQIIGHQPPQQQAAPQPPVATPQATQVPQQAKPTLPNIQGRGTSPVAKSPKSTDDLRALRQQRFG
jgi:hypothetical protein